MLPEEALDEDFVAWLELQGGNRHERLMDLAGGSGAIGSISFGLSPGGIAKIDSLFLVMICVHLARFLVVAGSSERISSLFSTLRLHLQSIATREDGELSNALRKTSQDLPSPKLRVEGITATTSPSPRYIACD